MLCLLFLGLKAEASTEKRGRVLHVGPEQVEAWPLATLRDLPSSVTERPNCRSFASLRTPIREKLQVLRLRASHSAQDDNLFFSGKIEFAIPASLSWLAASGDLISYRACWTTSGSSRVVTAAGALRIPPPRTASRSTSPSESSAAIPRG